MSILKRHRVMAATSAVVAGISVMLLPSAAVASPAQPRDVAVSAQQTVPTARAACFVRDGVASDGREVGRNPFRYDYGNSPYLGVRFENCADVVRIHFGGYTGITHYNLRDMRGSQRELSPREKGVLTITPPRGVRKYSWTVQACKRGGTFEKSSCTRWSPAVEVKLV